MSVVSLVLQYLPRPCASPPLSCFIVPHLHLSHTAHFVLLSHSRISLPLHPHNLPPPVLSSHGVESFTPFVHMLWVSPPPKNAFPFPLSTRPLSVRKRREREGRILSRGSIRCVHIEIRKKSLTHGVFFPSLATPHSVTTARLVCRCVFKWCTVCLDVLSTRCVIHGNTLHAFTTTRPL